MISKFFMLLYDFAYKMLKDYFIKKYKSELLESSVSLEDSSYRVIRKIKEIEKHKLVVPFQYNFNEQNTAICKFGCYFLCILFIAFVVKEIKDSIEKCFDKFEVNLLFKSLANAGCIKDANAYILSPNLIFKQLGVDRDIHYLDVHYSPADYKPNDCDILVGKYKDSNNDLYHFVIIDNDLNSIIWDSLGSAKAVRNGKLESLRVFKIVDPSLVRGMRQRLSLYGDQFKNN
ncbi:DUF261 family protein (plasmid) [Borrelia coriaceae]|uniref:Uncharacterized protein n=1 Tax=Borrelia coriaceae ATCC 43381 TaxID=1408429 RepID=W5SYE2_9SPIR|nr:DUF261 family protein [Borrelia coriaceae]AHH11738.1 Hypothetical protein BCO_0121801 [Borrelia coriaceae ATCC 43381]UPA17214.1 DUF261 family protein [Borrelia coriaceae]